jgi:hypothetical protein
MGGVTWGNVRNGGADRGRHIENAIMQRQRCESEVLAEIEAMAEAEGLAETEALAEADRLAASAPTLACDRRRATLFAGSARGDRSERTSREATRLHWVPCRNAR